MNAVDPSKPTSAAADQRPHEPSMEEILASIRRIIADDQSTPARSGREDELNLRASLEASLAPAPAPPPERRPDPVVAEPVSRAALGPEPALSAARPAAPMPDLRPEAWRPDANRSDPARTGSAPPRVVPVTATLGHIAAPQFAMPDKPPRAAEPAKREPDAEREKAPLRFELPRPLEKPVAERKEMPMADAPSQLFSNKTDQSVTAAFNTLAATRLLGNDDALKGMVGDMIRPMLKDWLDENLPSLVERLVRAEIERVARGGR